MLKRPPTSRPETMSSLQGYLQQCTPAAMEANVNLAANGSKNSVTQGGDPAVNAAGLAGPAILFTRATAAVDRPVNPAGAAPPIGIVANLQPGEESLSQSVVQAVQRALKTEVTGQLTTTTRDSIKEFERGMAMRTPSWGKETGLLAGKTRRVLVAQTPMPDGAETAFERALLTQPEFESNAIVPAQFAAVRASLGPEAYAEALKATGIADPPASDAEKWKVLRSAITIRRTKDGVPGTTIDSVFWEKIRIR
jgi:hypothetical protein